MMVLVAFPNASVGAAPTITESCVADSVARFVLSVIRATAPAMPVTMPDSTGGRSRVAARTVCGPGAVPSMTVVSAIPVASVVSAVGVMRPLPRDNRKLTNAPATGAPLESVARTENFQIGKHTSELQSLAYLVCRLLLEKKKQNNNRA